jgi:hypothetical protein
VGGEHSKKEPLEQLIFNCYLEPLQIKRFGFQHSFFLATIADLYWLRCGFVRNPDTDPAAVSQKMLRNAAFCPKIMLKLSLTFFLILFVTMLTIFTMVPVQLYKVNHL